jgi:hypothetical protein
MKPRRKNAPSPVDLIEDAVHLLREASFGTWVLYFTGTVPFVLGLLYFWADMSQSAFADQRAVGAALGMVLLFLWMKTFQALFAARLRASLIAVPSPRWTAKGLASLVGEQVRLQSWGLVVMPTACCLILPAGFAFGFFQILTALPEKGPGGSRIQRAWKELVRWPSEDFMTLLLLLGLWWLLAVNILVVIYLGPSLLKTLFDYETLFSRSPWAAFNTTLLMSVLTVSWLGWDPLVKAVHVIRVFKGEGRESGADLLARLRHVSQRMAGAAMLVLGLLSMAANAAEPSLNGDEAVIVSGSERSPVTTQELNRSIDEVLRQRRYSWRIPRGAFVKDDRATEAGGWRHWLRSFADSIGSAAKRVARWIADLFQLKGRNSNSSNISFADAATVLKWVLILLIAVVLGALVWLLVKAWIQRPRVVGAAADATPAIPDVSDENVGADQLPEDGWMRLAVDLMGKGDFRLALRALYLASLAHLAQREFIRLARHKSNRDYLREVHRRARALPEISAAFSTNVGAFDRVWYGRHPATGELVQEFRANLERIRAC